MSDERGTQSILSYVLLRGVGVRVRGRKTPTPSPR